MPKLITAPPYTPVEPVTEILHGVSVSDPYRWLEDQEASRTREWVSAQQQYARSYLDSISGRDRIRKRIRELLDVETYDSILKSGQRYFFRKRVKGQEQPCILFRDGVHGEDRASCRSCRASYGVLYCGQASKGLSRWRPSALRSERRRRANGDIRNRRRRPP